ncbi:Uncharacterised protein [Moraxella caprae]|uniref:Uncharacterized protein n=1 Tax=Moraxella caprae TaxID=90240 RepID=A0A378QZV4_9GAMM|nr:hypothetical protein [Moraxella caprae]STZ07967.1 Uncharacterised protein [Moraxella caprae]
MLIAYQAKINGNQIHWIDAPPDVSDVEVLILPKQKQDTPKPKRQPPKELQGQMQIVGDIFDMSESYQEWEHFK